MSKHLVICGAGHAHLTALLRIPEYIRLGHRVTVINSSSYLYYSGMGPGLLSGYYLPQEIRFNIKKMAENRGATFIRDTVDTVQGDRRIILFKSGKSLGFDVASFSLGSWVPSEIISTAADNILTVKPIKNYMLARRKILEIARARPGELISLVVVGGGAAGVETACALWSASRETTALGNVTLISAGRILKQFPIQVRPRALRSMRRRGINVIEDTRVLSSEASTMHLADEREIPFDLALLAPGVRPSDVFSRSGLPTGSDGGMLVNECLQSAGYPYLFGGGDCISYGPRPLEKVGVYAVRQNRILADNLRAALAGGKLRVFRPQKRYLQLLNMADGTALHNSRFPLPRGGFMFFLKDRIDSAFIRKFQLSGEQAEGIHVCT